jgi:O-antigen ligase
MVLFLLYDIKSKRVLTKRTRRVWAVIVVVVIIGAVRYSPIIISRFTGAEASLVGTGTSSRVYLALDAIRIIRAHPIAGVGLENYRLHAAEEIVGDKFVHCTYLLVAAETGIIGGIIFIVLLFMIIRYNLRIIKSDDRFISNVSIGVLTAIIAFCIAILPSPDYRIPWVKNHIWLLFGIVLALGKMDYWARRRRDRIRTINEIKRRSEVLRTKGADQQKKPIISNPNITSKGRRGL